MKNLSKILEEKDDAYASLILQAEILETLIALVAERPEARAMLAESSETIEAIVHDTFGEDEYDDADDEIGRKFEEFLGKVGHVTKEENGCILASSNAA